MMRDAQARAFAVRPALADDCREIARLHAGAFPRAWGEAAFMQFLADPSCITLVACATRDPAGFVVAREAGGEADIVTLGVAPHARRRGVGALLVAALADRLRGRRARVLFLEVDARNRAAIGLYRRAGFARAGRRPGYYPPQGGDAGGDALLLRLDLD